MLILGIDPSLTNTGLAILDTDLRYITYASTLQTSANRSIDHRLHHIYHTIRELIYRFEVTHAAIETQYMGKHHVSALKVAMACGACLVACTDCKIPVGHYSPACIKKNFTGIGNADKIMMIQQAKLIYSEIPIEQGKKMDSHIADAIATAHIHHQFI